jgi:solute carrier family 35 protein F1/2
MNELLSFLQTQMERLPPYVKAIIHGQLISVLIAGTGVFASILSSFQPSANFPLFMNFFNYLLLSFFLLRLYYRRSQSKLQLDDILEIDFTSESLTLPKNSLNSSEKQPAVHVSRWVYVLAAVLDVEANFLVLLAYNYTSITSVMLLDCFTIPCAMILSYTFLGCRYTKKHLFGTFICLLGLTCIVINDMVYNVQEDDESSSPKKHALMGDIFCLVGATLYASSNVIQETLVKFHSRDQYLGSLGVFGMLIALVQCVLFDLEGLKKADFSLYIVLSMFGFIVCLFLMYINTTAYLQKSDAILFNLSLLTSDIYAVIFTYFFYGYLVGWMYFLAFGLVIFGLVTYHSEKTPLQLGQETGSSTLHPLCVSFFLKSSEDTKQTPNESHYEYNPIIDDSIHVSSTLDGNR